MRVTQERGRRVGALLIGVACGLYMLAAATPAHSASPSALWQAPKSGTEQDSSAAGRLNQPRAVAASSVDGHVFVAEGTNARISEFTSWGVFVKAWGWGVRDGSAELQTCDATTGCLLGEAGDGPGQLDGVLTDGRGNSLPGISVDQAGNVWTAEGFKEGAVEDFRVQKFSPAGEFLLTVGREVDKTTKANICTAASKDVCGAGFSGSGSEEFSGKLPPIAVDSSGTVYVGDVGRIEALNPDGSFKEDISLQGKLAGSKVSGLAVDPTGGFYLAVGEAADVHRVDTAGAEVDVLDVDRPFGIATDVAGNVYVVNRPNVGPWEVLKFGPNGACLICHGDKFATPGGSVQLLGIATNVLGPAPPTVGDVYVSAFSPEGIGKSYVTAYGPNPRFEAPPLTEPDLRGEFAASAATTTASVQAEVNPHFYPATTYFVEYGTEDCALGGCAATGLLALGPENDAFAATKPVALSALQPGTTYHYRFVAANGPLTAQGEDRTFTTHQPSAAVLPDDRAYEMVSPPSKNNGEVGSPDTLGTAANQATASGEAITYASLAAFGESPKGAPSGSQYVSRRTPQGWLTENVTPPDQEGFISAPVQAFSEDLATAAIGISQPPLVAGAPEGVENLYLRDSTSGEIKLLTDSTPNFLAKDYCVTFEGASADFSHVFFVAKGSLMPEASSAEGFNLYEWSAADGIRIVSVLPNGSVAPPTTGNGFGERRILGGCSLGVNVTKNTISADGSRAYWTREINETSKILYLRLNASETVQVDKAQGGGGPSGNGRFRAASDDGSIAFFTAPGKLTAGSGAGALYRYDLEAEAGKRLSAITPGPAEAEVQGVLGASEDGRRIYFTAGGVFAPGGELGKPNLYLWEEGTGLRFIATLAGVDSDDWQPEPVHQTARTSPSGSSLAFLSTVALTGYDNTDQATGEPDPEAFLYDAATDQISCASCNPTGTRPIGPASLPVWSRPFQQPRYLSDDGRRLFFMSADALDLHDVNRRQDVYSFERIGVGDCTAQLPTYSAAAEGCIGLISPGAQSAPAVLVDASADGRDIFFGSSQRLVGQDVDENYDVYDARVDGGFPPPSPSPPPCSGDSCRPPAIPPAPSSPGSAEYAGPGNLRAGKHPHHKKHSKKRHKRHNHKAGRSSR
jgi:hypothetical protein